MSKENYWLALYQHVVDREYIKVSDLYKIASQDKNNYPQQLDLNFATVFGEREPIKVLYDIVESYDDKKSWDNLLYMVEHYNKKEAKENFYLNWYQAVVDKNLTRAVELDKLREKDIETFFGEYLDLDFKKVFQDEDPVDVILSILKSEGFEEFREMYSILYHEEFATEENIALREDNHREMMNLPLINYSPNLSYGFSPIEILFSISYSKVFNASEIEYELSSLLDNSLIKDVLSVIAASVPVSADKGLSVLFIGNNMREYDPTYSSKTGGYYNHILNRLVVTNKDSEINVGFIAHEFSHKAIDLAFGNNSTPYNNGFQKDKYRLAIKNTLLNIQSFIKKDFGLDIQFENQDDTWQMGKTLSSMLYPEYLDEEGVLNLISLFKQNNLNMNTKYSWLGDSSLLGAVLQTLNTDLGDLLIANGASVPYLKSGILMAIDMGLLSWFLENAPEININYVDQEGMTALDYAEDPEIISELISLGGIGYPLNYDPICPADYKDPEDEYIEVNIQLLAIEKFLMFYNQYDSSEEDVEFVVRLPQIISEGLYKGPIIEIFEPLAEYWQEEVSPAMQSYIAEHTAIGSYSVVGVENILFCDV